MADTECLNDLLVPLHVLLEEVVEEAAALVHESDETAAGGEILGVGLEVGGEVEDTLGHTGDLVLGGSGVVVPPRVLSTCLC